MRMDCYKYLFPMIDILKILPSPNKNKRYRVYYTKNSLEKYKDIGFKGQRTFSDDQLLMNKRIAYLQKACKIENKKGQRTYMIPGSSNSLSYWILW